MELRWVDPYIGKPTDQRHEVSYRFSPKLQQKWLEIHKRPWDGFSLLIDNNGQETREGTWSYTGQHEWRDIPLAQEGGE